MDGYKRLSDLLSQSKDVNLSIYNVLDRSIGPAVAMRANKEIKPEEFETKIRDSLSVLKQTISKQNMIFDLDHLSQKNDIWHLEQAYIFSNLTPE